MFKVSVSRFALFCSLFVGGADAAVILTFTEESGNVVMRTAGTLDLSSAVFLDDHTRSGADDSFIYEGGVGSELRTPPVAVYADRFTGVDLLPSAFSTNTVTTYYPSSGSAGFVVAGTVFWAFSSGDSAIANDDLANVTSYTPDRVVTWESQSFTSLGLGSHSKDVLIDMWATRNGATNDEKVQFLVTSSVPEPSSTVLLGLGALGLLAARRRSK